MPNSAMRFFVRFKAVSTINPGFLQLICNEVQKILIVLTGHLFFRYLAPCLIT